jgi:hypothetical protein
MMGGTSSMHDIYEKVIQILAGKLERNRPYKNEY